MISYHNTKETVDDLIERLRELDGADRSVIMEQCAENMLRNTIDALLDAQVRAAVRAETQKWITILESERAVKSAGVVYVPPHEVFREKVTRTRAEAIKILGGKCTHCAYDNAAGLEIDHVFEDGAEHRKTNTGRGPAFFEDVVRNGRALYQLLCGTHHNEKTAGARDRLQETGQKLWEEIANVGEGA